MSYQTQTWTRKPVLHPADAAETQQARRLLDRYEIDFEIAEPAGPSVVLEWNGVVYAGLPGLADFVMFVGRLPLPAVHGPGRSGDGRPLGTPIALP